MNTSQKTFLLAKSTLAMVYLSIAIIILSIIFYLVFNKTLPIESTVFGILILLTVSLAMTKKYVFINSTERKLMVTNKLMGITLSKEDIRISNGAIVQLLDEYQNRGQGHSACFLSLDIQHSNGKSILLLSEKSVTNRKKLVTIADSLTTDFRLEFSDLRSSRYKD